MAQKFAMLWMMISIQRLAKVLGAIREMSKMLGALEGDDLGARNIV